MKSLKKINTRIKRKKSIRKVVSGSSVIPRITVFRSNRYIYTQAIDDDSKVTLASASDAKMAKGTPIEKAAKVGEELGKLILKAKIERVVFDRNGYKYHGRVKALADGIRSAGVQF